MKESAYEIRNHEGPWEPCDAEQTAQNIRFGCSEKSSEAMAKLERGETVPLRYGSIRKTPAPHNGVCAASEVFDVK